MPVLVEGEMRNFNGAAVGKALIPRSVLTAVTEPPQEPPTEPQGEQPTEPPSARHLPAEGESPCAPIAGILLIGPLLVIGTKGRREQNLQK